MNKLRIIQNEGITEYCSSEVVSTLYLILKNGVSEGSLSGQIHVSIAKSEHINYITNHDISKQDGISKFHITADKLYLIFRDPAIELKLAQNYGDGVGVTLEDMQRIYNIGGFMGPNYSANLDIEYFDELGLFGNILKINSRAFWLCENLKSIDLSNITQFGELAFTRCTSLTNINTDFSNVTLLGINCFKQTNISGNINLENVYRTIGEGAFFSTKITGLTVGSLVKYADELCFF